MGVVAMDVGDFLKATFHFTVNGIVDGAIIVWDHECTQATGPFDLTGDGPSITEALIARYLTPFTAMTSDNVSLGSISLRNYADVTDGYDEFGPGWAGTGMQPMLPPFVTFSIQLTRANYAMRNGRKAYPGPQITQVDANGALNTATVDAIAAITDVWASQSMAVEGSMVDMTFDTRIVRDPTTPGVNPTVFSRVNGYGLAKFGTQNTRKR
jgi:hypothetical protein